MSSLNWPYELRVGWRYTRAGRAGRRNGFISFISGMSMLGIALGVAALIIVMSVMNGFQKEVRDRMLAAIPHVEITAYTGEPLADWKQIAELVGEHPDVVATAPFIEAAALIGRGESMQGAAVRGVLPADEAKVTPLAQRMQAAFAKLEPGSWNVALGSQLARVLGVREGEAVTIVTPGGQRSAAGIRPRFRQVTVAAIFEVGHFQYDSTLVLMHLQDSAELFRVAAPLGVQLRLTDQHQARRVSADLLRLVPTRLMVRDWTYSNSQWFESVRIQKRMMFIILTLIVAVAAFNLVSTMVMTVTDKQSDIAILRTLGASPRSVMGIFMVQGAASGVMGTAAGVALGVLVALNVDVIVPFIERVVGSSLLPGSIYLISQMPSDPRLTDIVPIALVSLLLAFGATLYPSWRASRVQPAQALRHD